MSKRERVIVAQDTQYALSLVADHIGKSSVVVKESPPPKAASARLKAKAETSFNKAYPDGFPQHLAAGLKPLDEGAHQKFLDMEIKKMEKIVKKDKKTGAKIPYVGKVRLSTWVVEYMAKRKKSLAATAAKASVSTAALTKVCCDLCVCERAFVQLPYVFSVFVLCSYKRYRISARLLV